MITTTTTTTTTTVPKYSGVISGEFETEVSVVKKLKQKQ